ncbi:unnamed protein product [Discosporangium mesarthrocarpum]
MDEHGVSYDDITCAEALSFSLRDPPKAREETLGLLQQMIRNRCENFGDGKCVEKANILILQDFLKSYGLEAQTHARPERPGRLNLVSSYGVGSPRVMLGPGHVDVVPVIPDASGDTEKESYLGWDEGPWSGAVRDGVVYGRGAVDMLGTVAAMAVTYVHIAAYAQTTG